MTNTFAQPFEIKHDCVDPALVEAIRKIDAIAATCGVTYFLAGATAREIMLRHVFGLGPGRRTLDVDFGIAVQDWHQFGKLKVALTEQGKFTPDPKKAQRLTSNSTPPVKIDLIPFGGVERTDQTISWPPDEDIVMRVSGFRDALESAVSVRLEENLVILVVSLPVLLVLKLFAWVDRKHEKRDADDIHRLLTQYGEAGNEDRLYGEHLSILEGEKFDFELAGARLIAFDCAKIISADTRKRALEILESDSLMEELTNQIVQLGRALDATYVGRCEAFVSKMRQGFSEVA